MPIKDKPIAGSPEEEEAQGSLFLTLQSAAFCTGKGASVTVSVAKPYHGDCDLTIKGFTDQGVAGDGHCKNLEENFGSTHLDADVSFTATP